MKYARFFGFFLMIVVFTPSILFGDETSNPTPAKWRQAQETIEKILTQNIISFWYPQTIDNEDGGYRLNHDISGKWQGKADKSIVTQARTVWFFSHLIQAGYNKNEYQEAAEHGFRFLADRMWDKEYGGFYWSVSSDGKTASAADKHLYGQSFGLYALAEFAAAAKNPEAEALARNLFRLLEYHAQDTKFGGYRESFSRNWATLPHDAVNYMGVPSSLKLMNTHLHLLESFTTYYQVTHDPLARERLLELIQIQSNTVVRKFLGACTDRYQIDWTPLRGARLDVVSYGHDLENLWLLIEACNCAGIANGPLMDLYRTLFDYSYRYGFDAKAGGFYDSGPFNQSADRRSKTWWVQAEALVAALAMYQQTKEELYSNCFIKTLEWINQHQIDWKTGDWFEVIYEDGRPGGVKAGTWKSPYHNGRAMLECLRRLKTDLHS